MAHQVLLRNSVWLILFAGFFGCDSNSQEESVAHASVVLNKNEQQITIENGLLTINKKPFNGTLFTYFPETKDTAELSVYLNGKEHGAWKKFHPSGQTRERRFFEHGKKTREYIVWWKNGSKQLHYFFVEDEYEGTCKEWNVEGKLVKVMNYKKGHEEGHQQWWYDNGKVKANYVIEDGRRYGLLGTKNCINVSDSVFSM